MCIAGLGEGLFALVDALGEAAPEIAEGAAAGLGGAAASGAFGGADASTASLATDATAPALDSSTISGLASTTGGAGVAGGGSTALLPEIDVTAASTAPGTAGAAAGGGSTGLSGLVAPAALAGGAGGGGSGVAGATGASPEGIQAPASIAQPADVAGANIATDSATGAGFFPATSDASISPFGGDLASQLGIDTGAGAGGDFNSVTGITDFTGGGADASGAGGGLDINDFGMNPGATSSWDATSADTSGTGNSFLQGAQKYLGNFKNDATGGLLALSLKNALSKPKLPGALGTAGANAGAATQGALSTIQSGGTATPQWSSQKASIDATINQQIQQQTQAILQAAASNGEGNQNSGIVQQQIAQMTQNANVQRQNLYAQAQQQNVSAALSELSGGDATLTAIGNTQLQQSEQAQALAAQTAELALLLQTGQKIPGSSGTGIPT